MPISSFAWTELSAFTQDQVITHTLLNQMCDNIEYLRVTNSVINTQFGVITTTSASFVSIGANFEATFRTYGGPVLALFSGAMKVTGVGTEEGALDIEVDAARLGDATRGLATHTRETNAGTVTTNPVWNGTFGRLITGLSDASHTFKFMWKVAAGGTWRLGQNNSNILIVFKEL